MPAIETTPELVRSVYDRLARNVETLRRLAFVVEGRTQ